MRRFLCGVAEERSSLYYQLSVQHTIARNVTAPAPPFITLGNNYRQSSIKRVQQKNVRSFKDQSIRRECVSSFLTAHQHIIGCLAKKSWLTIAIKTLTNDKKINVKRKRNCEIISGKTFASDVLRLKCQLKTSRKRFVNLKKRNTYSRTLITGNCLPFSVNYDYEQLTLQERKAGIGLLWMTR